MSFRSGRGGAVFLGKSPTEAFAGAHETPRWEGATPTAYNADDIVYTATTADTKPSYWRCLVDHTSGSSDGTGQSATVATKLDATKWKALPGRPGMVYGLQNWSINRTSSSDEDDLLFEDGPRVTNNANAETLTLNFLFNFQHKAALVLREINERPYVALLPDGEGTGKEIIEGYYRVGDSNESGDTTSKRSGSATLTADGKPTYGVQA